MEAEQAGRLIRSHILYRGQSDVSESDHVVARAVAEVRVYTESNEGSVSNSFDSQIIERLSF